MDNLDLETRLKATFRDVVTNVLFQFGMACGPFVSIGMLWNDTLQNVMAIVGGVFALLMILRGIQVMLTGRALQSEKVNQLMGDLFFPYVIGLSGAILQFNGIDSMSLIWLAVGFAVLILIGDLVPGRK